MYKEMNERSGGRGNFETWVSGDGQGVRSSGQTQKNRRRSSGSSGAADEKVSGLVKKVCHRRRHYCIITDDNVVRQ